MELDRLLKELGKTTSPSHSFLTILFKELRKCKIQRTDIVAKYGHKMNKCASGNDKWNIIEQILIAAIDVGDEALAEESIKLLTAKFPRSGRVGRLLGMHCESTGDFAQALEIYTQLLSSNPANVLIMKRKVCIHKAAGDLAEAVTELQSILKVFASDASSWLELGEIYLSISDYEAACHCFEELILIDPNCASYHTRLAEAYYTIGDMHFLALARGHFSMSLNLQNISLNLRAAYGLQYTCRALVELAPRILAIHYASVSNEVAVNQEMLNWITEQLQQVAAQAPLGSVLKISCA